MDYEPLIDTYALTPSDPSSSTPTPAEGNKQAKVKWTAKLNRMFDHIMSHPITEAGKTVARFVPGVGIFILGVDRLTRWKLIYSKNEPLVSHLERKMTDLTTIYIALAEIVQPHLNKKPHPQLELFARKSGQIKQLIDALQKQIEEFHKKKESAKLGLAEVIHMQFVNLQQILDELQREVVLHLSIHTVTHLQNSQFSLDRVLEILTQQKTALEQHGSALHGDVLALLERQIKSHEYMDACMRQLREDHTPGYAKVEHLEIRKLWFDFFRWPAVVLRESFVEEMPLYFEMTHDPVALKYWLRLQSQKPGHVTLEDIGFPAARGAKITAHFLNKIFPFDPVYEVKIGDWVLWAALGWLFLILEINKQYSALNGRGFFLYPTLSSKYLVFVSQLVQGLCSMYDYDAALHERLKAVSMYIRGCTSFSPFSDRFSLLILCLQESYLRLDTQMRCRVWPDEAEVAASVQQVLADQARLCRLAEVLGVDTVPWAQPDAEALVAAECAAAVRAHTYGTLFANKACHLWNGQFLLPTPTFTGPVRRLGPHTWLVQHLNTPVVLKALEHRGAVAVETLVKKVAVLATLHLGPHLTQTYGLTLFQNQCYAVTEYCAQGDLHTLLARRGSGAKLLALPHKLDLCAQLTNALRFLATRALPFALPGSLAHVYLTENNVCKLDGLEWIHLDLEALSKPTSHKSSELEVCKALAQLCIEILVEESTRGKPSSTCDDAALEEKWILELQQLPSDLLHFLFTLLSKNDPHESSLTQVYEFFKGYPTEPTDSIVLSKKEGALEAFMRIVQSLFDSQIPLPSIEAELQQCLAPFSLANFYLGDVFYFSFEGRAGTQDWARAKEWYQRAVEAKVAWGHVGLADFSYFGLCDVPRDVLAAEIGYSAGLQEVFQEVHPSTVARMYAGLGDLRYDAGEYVDARTMYQQALHHAPHTPRAWARLGDMHLHGHGTARDPEAAKQCYLKAAGTKRGVEGMLAWAKVNGDAGWADQYMDSQLLNSQDF